MTLIPNVFEAGQVAASSEVNENFQAVADAVGNDSTASRLNLPGDIVFGERDNAQISGLSDNASKSSRSFMQISWNAEQYGWGSAAKYRRFHDGEPAVQVRLGYNGFEVWTTSRTSGDLNSQLGRVFQIKATPGEDYCFIGFGITRKGEVPASIEDYRLTLVHFNTPKTIYENTTIYAGAKTRKATDYGVPANAKALLLSFEGNAPSSRGSILLTQARSSRSQKYGFLVRSPANEPNAGQGVVPLGETGDYAGCFVEDRGSQWNSASLYIQGYLY
jgi:hypothetical protein